MSNKLLTELKDYITYTVDFREGAKLINRVIEIKSTINTLYRIGLLDYRDYNELVNYFAFVVDRNEDKINKAFRKEGEKCLTNLNSLCLKTWEK